MKTFKKAMAAIMLMTAMLFFIGCNPEAEPGAPVIETDSITIIGSSVICGGMIISDGGSAIIERGVCWYSEPYPTSLEDHTPPVVSDHRIVDSGDLDSFSCVLNEYGPDSIYYFRAYARNDVGVSYGSEKGFVCIFDPNLDDLNNVIPVLLEDLPSVITYPVTDVTENQAVCHGAITDNGGSAIIEKGFCWRKQNTLSYIYESVLGSDEFFGTLNNLVPNTTYYVRAYAINKKGVGYGKEVSFELDDNGGGESLKPTITILSGNGFLGDGDVLKLHQQYEFGFRMSSPVGLYSLEIKVNNVSWNTKYFDGEHSCEYQTKIRFSDRSERTITGIVIDKDSNIDSVSFRVSIDPAIITCDCDWVKRGTTQFLVIEEDTVEPPYPFQEFVPWRVGPCSVCGNNLALHINGECTHYNINSLQEFTFNRVYYCDYSDENGMFYQIQTEKILPIITSPPYGTTIIISGKVTH